MNHGSRLKLPFRVAGLCFLKGNRAIGKDEESTGRACADEGLSPTWAMAGCELASNAAPWCTSV